jgi:hypothetical protein
MYPKYQPWVFFTPTILGACEDGKLFIDVSWNPGTVMFADVIGAVLAHVEAVHGASSGRRVCLNPRTTISHRFDALRPFDSP